MDQHSSGGPEEVAFPLQAYLGVAACHAVEEAVDPEAFPCHHSAALVGQAAFLVAVLGEVAYPSATVAVAGKAVAAPLWVLGVQGDQAVLSRHPVASQQVPTTPAGC